MTSAGSNPAPHSPQHQATVVVGVPVSRVALCLEPAGGVGHRRHRVAIHCPRRYRHIRRRGGGRQGVGRSRRRGPGVHDDPERRRPLRRRELLVLERRHPGAGVVEATQAGLEPGDVVFGPPAAELLAGRAQLLDERLHLGVVWRTEDGCRPELGQRLAGVDVPVDDRFADRRVGEQGPDEVPRAPRAVQSAGTSEPRRHSRRRTASAARARTRAPDQRVDEPAERTGDLVRRGDGGAGDRVGQRRGGPGRRRRGAAPARSLARHRSRR